MLSLASFVAAANAEVEDEAGCERRPLFAKRQFSNPDLHEALGAGTRATAEETLLDTVRAATNASGAILVDVGANRGDFAQLLLERWPSAELHVFEVLTPHVARLRARFASAPQVHVHHNAVSDVNSGTADIRGLPEWAADRSAIDGSVTGASLFTRSRRRRSYIAIVETVPLTTLDATLLPLLTGGGGGRSGVPFLKVDAEGADPQVLLGARRLLEAGVVEAVYFENNVLQRQGGHSLYRTVRYLHGLGYVAYYVGRQAQLLPLTRLCHSHAVFADKGTGNVVAARRGSAVHRALTSRLRVWM
tara:strand:- start:251 stop:1162 length:912 start_codon:yes stop_codon:yes gene_type:complete